MPYNPLDKSNLGKSVLEALLDCEAQPLGDLDVGNGAGVYAIYYRGDFPLYSPLKNTNQDSFELPIYVGKATPKGGRKGLTSLDASTEPALRSRLREHAKSVCEATNLKLEDFWCRFLVVDDIWIPLGESLTIQRFSPLWNQVLDGFGNHAPGKGRLGGARPLWDELHPGRSWAEKCAPAKLSTKEIEAAVTEYFKLR